MKIQLEITQKYIIEAETYEDFLDGLKVYHEDYNDYLEGKDPVSTEISYIRMREIKWQNSN